MFVHSFDGVKIHCKVYGTGKPVVLVHGVPGQGSNWKKVASLLKENFLVVIIDLRGYGRSEKPEEFSLSDHVKDINAVMREIHLNPEEVVLAGHSYGSMVSLAFSSRTEVRGLALISPPLILRKDFTDWMILHMPACIWKPLLFSSNFITRRIYRRMFFSPETPEEIYEEFIEDNADYISSLPPQSFRNISKIDYDARRYQSKARSVIVVGEHDGITPPVDARELADFLGAELHIITSAGHMILYEKPTELYNIIRRFIEETTG